MAESSCSSAVKAVLKFVADNEDDPRECYRAVQEEIAHLRERGDDVPAELVSLSRVMELECRQESQGR